MPILKDFRQTKEITLPGIPESKIEIYDSLLFGDTLVGKMDQSEQIMHFAIKRIKQWNLDDGKGNILPLHSDSIKLFSIDDATFLFNALVEFESKKK